MDPGPTAAEKTARIKSVDRILIMIVGGRIARDVRKFNYKLSDSQEKEIKLEILSAVKEAIFGAGPTGDIMSTGGVRGGMGVLTRRQHKKVIEFVDNTLEEYVIKLKQKEKLKKKKEQKAEEEEEEKKEDEEMESSYGGKRYRGRVGELQFKIHDSVNFMIEIWIESAFSRSPYAVSEREEIIITSAVQDGLDVNLFHGWADEYKKSGRTAKSVFTEAQYAAVRKFIDDAVPKYIVKMHTKKHKKRVARSNANHKIQFWN